MDDRGLTQDQLELVEKVRQFRTDVIDPLEPHKREWIEDPDLRFPWEVVEEGSRRGLRTLSVPREYGGADASMLDLCLTVEELAAGDMGIAVIFDQTWKIANTIGSMATQEQKEWFYPDFVSDHRFLLSIGIVEPDHATDVFMSRHLAEMDHRTVGLNTTAILEDGHWVINGAKAMPSLASTAKLVVVLAQTEPDVPIHEGGTYFLVPTDTPGFRVGRIWDKMSQRLADNAAMVFDNCRIPQSQQLGERGRARHFPMTSGGNIEAGATTLGTARAAYEAAVAYARERIQGGRPLIEHQAIGMMLAEMAIELEAARSLIWQAASAYDRGSTRTPLQFMAKWFAVEAAVKVCMKSMEVFGGFSIMRDMPVQKYMRDCLSFLHSDGSQQSRLMLLQQRMLDPEETFFASGS